jgi:1-acyl-sn-glycerol-3-phosphate acyltransferase
VDVFVRLIQTLSWLLARLLRLRFALRARIPAGLFADRRMRRLILAPEHRSFIDPWLIAAVMRHRHVRNLLPVRILGTQTFDRLARWTPFIRLLYRGLGVVALPPRDEAGSLEEKTRPLLGALDAGDPVVIFPEGHVRRIAGEGAGTFRRGVVHIHRLSRAPIVLIAIRLGPTHWPRRSCTVTMSPPLDVPAALDLEASTAWLREQMLALDADL